MIKLVVQSFSALAKTGFSDLVTSKSLYPILQDKVSIKKKIANDMPVVSAALHAFTIIKYHYQESIRSIYINNIRKRNLHRRTAPSYSKQRMSLSEMQRTVPLVSVNVQADISAFHEFKNPKDLDNIVFQCYM